MLDFRQTLLGFANVDKQFGLKIEHRSHQCKVSSPAWTLNAFNLLLSQDLL